jgi:hypothetical protein
MLPENIHLKIKKFKNATQSNPDNFMHSYVLYGIGTGQKKSE